MRQDLESVGVERKICVGRKVNPIGEVITVWGACEQGGYKKRQGKPGPNYEPLFIAGKVLSWPRNCYVSATVLLALHPVTLFLQFP